MLLLAHPATAACIGGTDVVADDLATVVGASTGESAAPGNVRLLTRDEEPGIPPGMIAIEIEGMIDRAVASRLDAIWRETKDDQSISRIVVNLDSAGGWVDQTEPVLATLAEMRDGPRELVTLVENGNTCGSLCVILFVQGEQRIAYPASAWMFHGCRIANSVIPDPARTETMFGYLRERGIDSAFIDDFFAQGLHQTPGELWLSGTELAERSDIILKLMPNWMPLQ